MKQILSHAIYHIQRHSLSSLSPGKKFKHGPNMWNGNYIIHRNKNNVKHKSFKYKKGCIHKEKHTTEICTFKSLIGRENY